MDFVDVFFRIVVDLFIVVVIVIIFVGVAVEVIVIVAVIDNVVFVVYYFLICLFWGVFLVIYLPPFVFSYIVFYTSNFIR